MMQQLRHWFQRPYPLIVDAQIKFFLAAGFGLFVFAFLWYFQPFGIANIEAPKFSYLIGFGSITTGTMLLLYFGLPLVFPKTFDAQQWTVIKEISMTLTNIVVIAITNYWYNSIVGEAFATQHNIVHFLGMTISIGLFPVLFSVLLLERFWAGQNQQVADNINQQIQQHPSPTPTTALKILSESPKDYLEISAQDFLFAKSEGNYVKCFYQQQDKVTTKLLRTSLKKVEEQLVDSNTFIRCHRSYLVNKQQIQKVSGNARSYSLHFANCETTAAVSRNFPKELLF